MRMSQALSREVGFKSDKLETLLREIRGGMPLRFAAGAVGVSPGRLQKWVDMGGEGIEPFVELYEAYEAARSTSVREQVNNVKRAAKDPRRWQAAAWLLERIAPEEFSKERTSDHGPLEIEVVIGGRGENGVGGPEPEEDDDAEDNASV